MVTPPTRWNTASACRRYHLFTMNSTTPSHSIQILHPCLTLSVNLQFIVPAKKDGDCNWPRCSDLRLTTDEPKSSRPDNTPWQPLTPVIPEFPHIQPEVPAKPEVAPQSTENQNDIPLPVSAPPEETGSNPAIVTASETQVKSNENVPATAAPLLSNDLVNLTLTAFLNTLRSEEESTS